MTRFSKGDRVVMAGDLLRETLLVFPHLRRTGTVRAVAPEEGLVQVRIDFNLDYLWYPDDFWVKDPSESPQPGTPSWCANNALTHLIVRE